ncbi:MAG: glycerol-3-phosphate 1-O-acyltransferase PlsY [Alistipes sp.]|nr:glycerol-3-phosphate 1-O-acyltransferase PlsY [Alistipes sp.]
MGTWEVTTWLSVIALMIAAYLLGSIPSAVWIGKKYYGIDIREHGSKNAGTTNMLRVLGKRAAIPVFIIDYFKGFVAVILTSVMRYDDAINDAWLINLRIIATVFVVLGHIYPIFAGFKGGKGVATLLGAGTGIYAPILLLCFGVWCFVFAIWHYVSLASMVAGCCYPCFVMIFSTMTYNPAAPFESVPFIVFSWVVAILLVWTHRKNISRLRGGTESQIFLWGGPDDDTSKK